MEFVWGNLDPGSSATTRYMSPGYEGTPADTTTKDFRVRVAMTFSQLAMHARSAGGASANTLSYTLRVNGVLTALTTGAISPATVDSTDAINSVIIAVDDLIGIEIHKSGAIGSPPKDVFVTIKAA